MNRRLFLLRASALTLLGTPGRRPRSAHATFDSWPQGSSPEELGVHVAERFVVTPMPAPLMYEGTLYTPDYIGYWETCAWYGALTFAQLSRNKELTKRLVARFEPLFRAGANLIRAANHGEPVFGVVPLEIYRQTRDEQYLAIGKELADGAWRPPPAEWMKSQKPDAQQRIKQALKDGLTWQTYSLDGADCADDAYLATILPVLAYRATGERVYLGRAAREMLMHVEKLQQPNGLFFHGENAPFFWGRGNGWAAAGLTELLRALPADHPDRPRIMDSYRKMMIALLKYQDENGMWKQLLDHPTFWPETSCTGMFTFAFVTGVNEGWLDARSFAPAARKSWLGLIKYINQEGDIAEVCEGTVKSTDERYYANRRRNNGDLHGQAAVLWSASAFLRGCSKR